MLLSSESATILQAFPEALSTSLGPPPCDMRHAAAAMVGSRHCPHYPTLFGLFSLVTLMAANIIKNGQLPVLKTAWYRKEQATFSDIIALVRHTLWSAQYSVNSLSQPQSTEFISDLVNQLLEKVSEAA
jgi:hypothetical protein